ncbi:MAG: ribosome biogenesis GTPase YlqF [Caldanaerobacter sp.]|uniref:ribosome biogenesis GTPase YlqF n=1 Tax=Caldanaerobacter sp. TaxID=2930036 RepID=UPI003C712168
MINWYPGHMAKAKKEITNNLKLVDVVYEIVDARIPKSSRNPDFDEIIGEKKRIILLNKEDLADENITEKWIEHYKKSGIEAVKINSITGRGFKELEKKTKEVCKEILEKKVQKGLTPRLRGMILGIPNVGKSTFINTLIGEKKAKTGNKPGVTKNLHWIRTQYIDLLDTPGILWPKFEDKTTGLMLAITGAIKDEILDVEEVALYLVFILKNRYPDHLINRYKLDKIWEEEIKIIEEIGKKRGCFVSGGKVDFMKASFLLLEDFRRGNLGRISLEEP